MPVEYYNYNFNPLETFTYDKVHGMFWNDIDDYGFGFSQYSSQRLYQGFLTSNTTIGGAYENALGVQHFWNYCTNMRTMMQDILFGGSYDTVTAQQMIEGYTTDVNEKINGGNFFAGADFDLSSEVTPIDNSKDGTMSWSTLSIYSGSNGNSEISKIRMQNDESYINRIQQVWNGTYYTNVT